MINQHKIRKNGFGQAAKAMVLTAALGFSVALPLPGYGFTMAREQPVQKEEPVQVEQPIGKTGPVETEEVATLDKGATDFTLVAKKAIPAVVSIKVTANSKKKRSGWLDEGDGSDLNLDFFNDDFWSQFFGLPSKQGRGMRQTPMQGQGSGFIVSSDGIIMTNNHVVNDMATITVTLHDGREFEAKVLGQDPNTDIALVKIDASDLPYLQLGNSDQLQVGQWVVAIGNPLGLQASLTVGVVSATGRNNLDIATFEDFIQTDATINRGNSGGPLLDLSGRVIGINTAIVSNMATGGYVGIGFAIPSNIASYVMDQILEHGEVARGYLGVTMQDIDKNLAHSFGLNKVEGIVVTEVMKDSPADKAGLQQGDVIVKYNQKPVNTISGFRTAIAMMKQGTKITLTVIRDKKTIDLPVVVGDFPKKGLGSSPSRSTPKPSKLGFEVEELSPALVEKWGYQDLQGVVISEVESYSPAERVGIKKGALVLAVNKKQVTTVKEFNDALEAADSDKPILLLIKQGDAIRFVSLKVN